MGVMGAGSVWTLLLLIGLVGLVVWLVKILFPQGNPKEATTLDIAHERLTKGELTHEEFEHMRHDLMVSRRDSHA